MLDGAPVKGCAVQPDPMGHCYTCKHYRTEERRKRTIERCAAKGMAELEKAAIVDDMPAGLIPSIRFDSLAADRRAFIFGSPGEYYLPDYTLAECPDYEREER